VVEVAEEVVREELLGGAERAVGSVGWGIDRSGHPLVRYSQRKTVVGKSRGPASLAVAVGRLLAHEGAQGRGTPFGQVVAAAHRRRAIAGIVAAGVEQSSEACGQTEVRKSEMGDGSLT
jgi:hypothetical protein